MMDENTLIILSSIIFTLILGIILLFIVRLITSKIYELFIPYIKEKHYGQVIRKEGMETHFIKEGTPTMGGIVFISVFVLSLLVLAIINMILSKTIGVSYQNVCMIVYIIALAIIGYIDDKNKITKHSTDGLKAKYKFILQILISLIFILLIYYISEIMVDNKYIFVFDEYREIHIPILEYFHIFDMTYDNFTEIIFIIINVFILVGVANGTNFTDGIDSLLANVTIVISVFFMVYSVLTLRFDLFLPNIIMCGVLLGFRKHNKYPAKIFMGDTGSLGIGAYIGAMSILLGLQYKLPIFGFIYMIEVLSVILQVSYFKITKGKRLFLMSPIHHHFEKKGWSENKIVKVFTIITIILCIISILI